MSFREKEQQPLDSCPGRRRLLEPAGADNAPDEPDAQKAREAQADHREDPEERTDTVGHRREHGGRDRAADGDDRDPDPIEDEVHAWAIMGMNVFLGLRFGVWGDEDRSAVAKIANRMLRDGLAAR